MKRIVLIALAMLVVAVSVQADIQQKFQIQGVLKDNDGVVMPDGDYTVTFKVYDAPTGGLLMWSDDSEIIQENGVFTAMLLDFYPDTFHRDTWLELTFEGETPMMPRISITPVPVALAANSVDPDNAVVGLNGKKGSVTLVGGTNVTVVPSGSSNEITINATTGAGGDDGDWTITGNDVSHAVGRVWVGMDPVKGDSEEIPPLRGEENGDRDPLTGVMTVTGLNEGIKTILRDSDDLADGRSALFARRLRTIRNDGTGFQEFESNSAIVGYNDWGDSYTFGVAGYTWFDYNNTGAVLGSKNSGDYWGSLAFRDDSGDFWGMYTPNNLHVGGVTETTNLRMSSGASEGYIMTSDAEGNATWSPAGAAESDGDWTISGSSLYHSGAGAVAIGTSVPHNWNDSVSATTLQVKAMFAPTLALDAQGMYPYNQLHRWTMTGGSSGVQFNYSNVYDSYGTTAMLMKDTGVEFNDHNGDKMAELITYNGMDLGGSFQLFGPYSSIPTFSVDGHIGGGGSWMRLYNGDEQAQVIITGNHSSSGVGRVITPVLEITGGSDLSEKFDIGNASLLTEPGMVVSIDPDNPGQLTLSETSYDRRVAGVISGAGGVNTGMVMGQRGTVADGELPVALVGRVYVWADASEGPIEPGDLLTTSDLPGHAMKVTDHDQATGAILGKAMTGLSEGQGLILTLVTLQ